jgi:hypothetical protein
MATKCFVTLFSTLAAASPLAAQNNDQLAKQLANPLAALTSVPLQLNFEREAGLAAEADRVRLNVQPVIPKDLGDDWNLISRTILPVVNQDELAPGIGAASGIGDVTQSFFFSPDAMTKRGWTWGVGPVLLAPTASDEVLGADRWAAGPTAVLLRQTATGWTYGGLFNHLESFGGDGIEAEISNTLVQLFVSRRIGPGRTVSANVESTYDWEAEQWTVPVHVAVSQVLRVGRQMLSVQGGVGRYVESSDLAPAWGLRLTMTLMFPKGRP